MRQKLSYSFAAICCATALAACGKSDGSAFSNATKGTSAGAAATSAQPSATVKAKQKEPEPCSLITKTEAETLAGTPLMAAEAVRQTCTYSGPPSGPLAQVEIFVGDGAKKFLDLDRELGHEFVKVAGIGDEAHAEDGAIFVRVGTVWVALHLVTLEDQDATAPRLESAARIMAKRI